jgi:hypothetical protein
LRLKKPQPPSLSRVLRQELDRRIKIFDRKVLLGNYWIPISAQEDEWDEILETELGFTEKEETRTEGKWVDEVEHAHSQNAKFHERDLRRSKAMAKIMLELVDKETELALKEGQKIIRGRPRPPKSKVK